MVVRFYPEAPITKNDMYKVCIGDRVRLVSSWSNDRAGVVGCIGVVSEIVPNTIPIIPEEYRMCPMALSEDDIFREPHQIELYLVKYEHGWYTCQKYCNVDEIEKI